MFRVPVSRTSQFVLLGSLLIFALTAPVSGQDVEPTIVYDLDATEDGFHFSLRENRVVPVDELTDENWDLLFQGTMISVNGKAQLLERAFDLVQSAPESDYKMDDPSTGTAIPAANHEGWYDYDPASHMVMPIPDRTIAVVTKDGTYAKLEIMSYYEGQMPGVGSPRFYTFRFVHQADGSRDFR